MPETTTQANPYDLGPIFQPNGPIEPTFITEAVRTIMRALPLADEEPAEWGHRRMFSAMVSLAALHPRDEIEVMLGVQAISAYHAAAACWRLGMNLQRPCGNSIRHFATAASNARTFDTMLKAIERRQVKPLAPPAGPPPASIWPAVDPTAFMKDLENRCSHIEPKPQTEPPPNIEWTQEALALAEKYLKQARTDKENEGLDIANTEGILPGGGMIVMDDPTPNQMLYMGRRLALMYRREYDENLRKGINKYPRIRGIKTGDLIP